MRDQFSCLKRYNMPLLSGLYDVSLHFRYLLSLIFRLYMKLLQTDHFIFIYT